MRAIRVLAALGLILGSFALATPVAAGDPCFHDMRRPPVTEGAATVVKMDLCAFVPTIVHVPVGTQVQFLNTDVVGHEVVGANLVWGQHDKILDSGDQLGVRFAKAGIHPYACMIHPGMTGAIIVGDAAAVGAAPAGGTVDAPAAGAGAAAQGPADPAPAEPAAAPTASGVSFSVPAVLGLVVAALAAALGASLAIRRRRSSTVGPTA